MQDNRNRVRFSPAKGRRANGGEAGFSLLEAIVATMLSLLLIGGVAEMLNSVRDHYVDLQDRIDAQQGARIAMEQIQRDLQVAGVGLSRLQPPFPVVLNRADGGIDLRINRGQATTFLVAPQATSSAPLAVDSTAAFAVGELIAVYDAGGSIDLATITSIDTGNDTISHDGLSKPYDPADGAAVAVVETITYRTVDAGDGTFDLMRDLDGTPSTMANHVVGLTFTYFDSQNPPQQFTPATDADRLQIRSVRVQLGMRTAGVRLDTGTQPQFTLTARVTPRSLVLF